MDRVIDLPDRLAFDRIKDEGFGWYLEGDNADYVAPEALVLYREEGSALVDAATDCFKLFQAGFEHVSKNNLWNRLGIPDAAVPLIKYSWEHHHPHVLGRFDFAGGIGGLPVKLIEFNADTCTQLAESAYFQRWILKPKRNKYHSQINSLIIGLESELSALKKSFPDTEPTLLLTSFGHIDDKLNLEVVRRAAERVGFEVDYADLKDVIFDEDAVLLEVDGGYAQYNFIYKLVPWEFIMIEEPELLHILTDLVIKHDVVIVNPAYSIVFQAKRMLSVLYELFPKNELLLPCFDERPRFPKTSMVQKLNFGRLGENIQIYNTSGKVIEETLGDSIHEDKMYQAFAHLFVDADTEVYQGGVYLCNGRPCCISFRRSEGLIIDDDAEFVSHTIA